MASAIAAALVVAGSGIALFPSVAVAAPGDPIDLMYVTEGVTNSNPGVPVVVRTDKEAPALSTLPANNVKMTSVSPDGRRTIGAIPNGGALPRGVRVVDLDGTNPVDFVPPWNGWFRAGGFSTDGSRVYLVRTVVENYNGYAGEIMTAPADGSALPQHALTGAEGFCDNKLATSVAGIHVFERGTVDAKGKCGYPRTTMLWNEHTGSVEPLLDVDGKTPVGDYFAVSPDGTRLAYGAAGPYRLDVLDLTTRQTTTFDTPMMRERVSWSPDGTRVAIEGWDGVWVVDVATRKWTRVRSTGTSAVWLPKPVLPDLAVRVHGTDAIATAVATSRFKYAPASSTEPDARKAKVAVLTRSDAFYDGLAGAGLAGAKDGPMLLTPRQGLPASVAAELTRVLSKGSTVYILGGTGALTPEVDRQVRALGLIPERLAGAAVADTGVAIAQATTTAPEQVFVATAAQYYDALAAGAAAGSTPGTTVVFTWGETLPPATSRYLAALDRTRTKVVAVGGPALRALTTAKVPVDAKAFGTDAPDTARQLATYAFQRPTTAALATMQTWQDALSGGALIAGNGPLLLTNRYELPVASRDYLATNADSLDRIVLVGGRLAIDDVVAATAGRAFGPLGLSSLVDSPNGDVKVPLG